MTIIPFFNKEERALIDECRIGTSEHRLEILRHLEYLLECMVDEGEKDRLTCLIKVIGREVHTTGTSS